DLATSGPFALVPRERRQVAGELLHGRLQEAFMHPGDVQVERQRLPFGVAHRTSADVVGTARSCRSRGSPIRSTCSRWRRSPCCRRTPERWVVGAGVALAAPGPPLDRGRADPCTLLLGYNIYRRRRC